MIKLGILFGGRSGEHDVSLCSAASVVSAINLDKYEIIAIGIDKDGKWYVQDEPVIIDDDDFGKKLKLEKKGNWFVSNSDNNNKLVLCNVDTGANVVIDVIFPVVHGTFCEDGTLQGLLELAMVPYVGADVIGSSVGMDKDVAKRLLRDGGIPIVPWYTYTVKDWEKNSDDIIKNIINEFGYPVFVKPANAGSSVGVKKIEKNNDFRKIVEYAFKFDNKILIEKGINCREIECAVLGNEEPEASCLGEVIPKHEFYSYEAKYIDPEGADLAIPASVDEENTEIIRKAAVDTYKLLCCTGMARVDFFLEKDGDNFFLNEINTLPGFTSISMYPKLWAYSGLKYSDLIDKLIDLAIDRHKNKMRIKTEL